MSGDATFLPPLCCPRYRAMFPKNIKKLLIMKRLYYILIMIIVGMFASCSLSFDSFIDEEDADLANIVDCFTAHRLF